MVGVVKPDENWKGEWKEYAGVGDIFYHILS